jgi:tRNA G46 methylase TrmB
LLSFDSFGKFTKEFSTINLYQNLCDLKDNVQTEYEQKFINQNVTIKKIIWKKN